MVFRAVILLTIAVLLAGCNSLKFENALKTTATTAITYATGGVVPAVASMATSMAYDEVVQDPPSVNQIEKGNNQQLYAFAIEQLVYGAVAITGLFFAFMFLARWSGVRRERKDQYFRDMETPASRVVHSAPVEPDSFTKEDMINAIKKVKAGNGR